MEKEIACGRGFYFINEMGEVFSTRRGEKKKMNPFLRSGYPSVEIVFRDSNPFRKTFKVHKLMWETFNGEVPEGFVVDHIDRNKENNLLSNLRLVTLSENSKNRDSWTRTAVECTNISTGEKIHCPTQAEASRLIGCNAKTLSDYLNGGDIYSNIKGWTVVRL